MKKDITLSVRATGPLAEFVSGMVGDEGPYESSSEYVRDLIRRDKERLEALAFQSLKNELDLAFATPRSDYRTVTADEVIARNRPRRAA